MTRAQERKAAIALLREAPEDCEKRAPLGSCGRCWTCRIRLFLRVVDHEERRRGGAGR